MIGGKVKRNAGSERHRHPGQQSPGAGWFYKFLVLTGDRGYREVIVDALSNAILQIRQR